MTEAYTTHLSSRRLCGTINSADEANAPTANRTKAENAVEIGEDQSNVSASSAMADDDCDVSLEICIQHVLQNRADGSP